jgi:uncharacterized protein YeaO (DUF488 family)
MKSLHIKTKRVYDPASKGDGRRILVDRLWPRGLSKARAKLDAWMKDIAPSDELRKWFRHDPEKWIDFQKRYFAELEPRKESLRDIAESARTRTLTFLYSARENKHNNAEALRNYIRRHYSRKAG